MRSLPILSVTLLLVVGSFSWGQTDSDELIDFNTQIRPILSNNCYACHGPDEKARAADVRLDTHEGATDWVIDLDYPDDSELLVRVLSDDEGEVMPPPKHGKPLSKADVELLRKWIHQGAKYAKHWAYQKPVRPELPNVQQGRAANPIDHFILSRLARSPLQQSESADRRTLIRRLALDLTGLPPTPNEVESFLADESDNAYETLVEHYLNQDAYGERWAAVWLDLARYADSAGFAEDKKRTIWAYRDYVIRSYNDNKPFDRFTIEQLAGDLLPNPSEESKIATAFHRNTLTNSEGGTSDEEFRSAAVVDRVNTTMAVWMGTTMACAQCHTHKYDPITQKEYFQFYDFLNQTADNDQPNESPLFSIYRDGDLAKRKTLEKKLASLQQDLNTKPTAAQFQQWETEFKQRLNPLQGQFVRIDLPGNQRILSLAEVQVYTGQQGKNVAPQGKATQSSTAYAGPPEYAIDGNTSGQYEMKSVTHTETESDPWWQVDLGSEFPIQKISIWNRDGLHQRLDGYQLTILNQNKEVVWTSQFVKAIPSEHVVDPQDVPENISKILKQSTDRTPEQNAAILDYYQLTRNLSIQSKIADLEVSLKAIRPSTTVPIYQELPGDQRRTTQVQIRGNYLDTGETVTAGTPETFHPLPKNAPLDRMTLAKWLVDSENPLAARVLANRYWEQIFGTGLVATSEEFGAQGDLPSHPELLDWLASELTDHQWDTRRLLKLIVMSETYRQSSVATPQSIELDPNNRLLARGPRVRLSAEMIRDQALAVSGLLSRKMYGPPVQPPQPKVGLKPAFTGATTDWTDSVGEDRYRRGIYTEWRRSSPYPSMATFDVNSREVCEIRRIATNTPLQALVTLNDPVYVEAAQALARRVTQNTSADPKAIAQRTFQICLIRKPTNRELQRIVDLYNKTRQHFTENPDAARQLATDPLNPPADGTDLVELAAWTTVANVILNLDEMLMKP